MTNIAALPTSDTKPINALVGLNVNIIMLRRGKTQKELALAIGVNQTSMSRRISGITDWSPDEMQKVADLLDVKVARLFEELPDVDSNHEPAVTSLAAYRRAKEAAATTSTAHVRSLVSVATH